MKNLFNRMVSKVWTTDAAALNMASEIVAEHAPRILEELGLSNSNDGILDRIEVNSDIRTAEDPAAARFIYKATAIGPMGLLGCKYNEGSGRIEIRALSAFYHINKKKNKRKHTWFARPFLFRPLLRRQYKFVLAHEMRHYWQYITGEAFKHMVGSVNFIPYEWRWEEQDADKFGLEYAHRKDHKTKEGH